MDDFNEKNRQDLLNKLKEEYNLAVAILRKVRCGDEVVYLTLLIGGLENENPKAFMDNVVSKYVQSRMFNEYIDSHLDNPWFRIIIEDVNDLINEKLPNE